MNEEMFPNQDDQVLGPGKLLQIAREEKNLRTEDVAYEIRLTPSQVLALEENDYSRMPEETYVRGYLRNYARLVDIPENTILMAFARQTRSSEKKPPQAVIPTSEGDINKGGKGIRLFAVIIIIAVFALSAVWVLLPHDKLTLAGKSADSPPAVEKSVIKDKEEIPVGASTLSLDKPVEPPIAETKTPAPSTSLPASEGVTAPVIMSQPAADEDQQAVAGTSETDPLQDQPQTETETSTTVQAAEPAETGVIASTDSTAVVAETAETENVEKASPAETVSDGTLIISYTKDSWTDVRDANGKKLLYRTVKTGEKIALAGKLPMSVFFGFAQGVKVTFNGKEIDVPAYTRGVFARFTVGEPENQ